MWPSLPLLLTLVDAARASSLIGNPTFTLDTWGQEPLVSAPVASPRYLFEDPWGNKILMSGAACDLVAGCTVSAPFGPWVRVQLQLPSGVPMSTGSGTWLLSGGLVAWEDLGAPVDVWSPSHAAQLQLVVLTIE